MKNIQWFPGHMAKAMRLMEDNLKLCDAVVFVLDARAPAATYNSKLQELTKNKPVLYLFNKADLAGVQSDELFALLRNGGKSVLRLNACAQSEKRNLLAAMNALVREKAERLKEKGVQKPLRFLIAGVPNTGKSTLINLLCGARRAVTGDKAGVTKTKQWVKCGAFDLMDTPGTMPPSFRNQTLARRLAYLGSINDDILELDEIALALLEDLSVLNPAGLMERYGITEGTPLEMLNKVCARRGFLLKGNNDYDYERGERAVLDDFRKGKLGKVCFDSADDLKEVGLL